MIHCNVYCVLIPLVVSCLQVSVLTGKSENDGRRKILRGSLFLPGGHYVRSVACGGEKGLVMVMLMSPHYVGPLLIRSEAFCISRLKMLHDT